MRILLLTKRQYTGQDLLAARYGRLWEIPKELSRRGHEVRGLALSYRELPEEEIVTEVCPPSPPVVWRSINAGPTRIRGLWRYYQQALDLGRDWKPQVVMASSDTFFIVMGARIGRLLGAPFVADLYDNYEAFSSARIPGLARAYRSAVRNATVVSCVSAPLRDYVIQAYRRTGPTHAIENAVDPAVFHPRDKLKCRARLGLPMDAQIIGTAGALTKGRGIGYLYDAFRDLAGDLENLHLVVAGPRDMPVPAHPRIHDLGELPWSDVPVLLNALDVGVICNIDSRFGRYCFPQKAFEMLACGVPFCAARVGSMGGLLAPYPEYLFEPASSKSLVSRLRDLVPNPKVPDIAVPTWAGLAERLETLILADKGSGEPAYASIKSRE